MTKTSDGFDVPFKLNEFTEEQKTIDVRTPEGIEKMNVTEKVMYVDVPPKPFICAFEKHIFGPVEHKMGNLQCRECGFITQLSPLQWKIVDGRAVPR